jgi:hypothetical protein
MTSEGLGEVFKGDSADMCTGKFPLVSMGGRAERQACADGERGPTSARAEIFFSFSLDFFRLIAQSPRRGFHRNSNFWMGS